MQNLKKPGYKPAVFLLYLCLLSCANQNPGYKVIVPVAESNIIQSTDNANSVFELHYKYDAEGQILYKTVHSSGEYRGSDRETFASIKEEAKQRMIRQAVDEANGVIISAKTDVYRRQVVDGEQASSFTDITDETLQHVAGFARVINMDCKTRYLDGGITQVSCAGLVEVPEIDLVRVEY